MFSFGLLLILPAAFAGQRGAAAPTPAEKQFAVDIGVRSVAAPKRPLTPAESQLVGQVRNSLRTNNLRDATSKWRAYLNTGSSGNAMEVLFVVLREAIVDMNEDKKYYLQKIAEANKALAALSAYLTELTKASQELAQKEREKEVRPVTVAITAGRPVVRRSPPTKLDANGVRAEVSRTKQSEASLEYYIGQAGRMLKGDNAKDIEFLKKILETFRAFAAELKKKLAEKGSKGNSRVTRPPSQSTSLSIQAGEWPTTALK